MIKLFDVTNLKQRAAHDALSLSTTLGEVNLEVMVNGSKLSITPPAIAGETPKKASVYGWSLKDLQIELLKAFVEPSLPFPIRVSRCVAFLWRFKTFSSQVDLKFSCRLSFRNAKLQGDPESGEGLISQSWDSTGVKLSIGTEDEEYLLSRSESQKWLPIRLANEKLLPPEIIEYLEDGILVTLPTFLKNEEGQIQFIVAWAERSTCRPTSSEIEKAGTNWFAHDVLKESPPLQGEALLLKRQKYSTWFAVDISYQEILKLI